MWRRVASLMDRGETMQSLEIKSAALEETSRVFASKAAPPPSRLDLIKLRSRFYLEWLGFFACPCLPFILRHCMCRRADQGNEPLLGPEKGRAQDDK